MPDELDLAPGHGTLVYGVPKLAHGLPVDADPTDEVKADQKEFFRLLYNLLVDKDRGPRLPTLIVALGAERIRTPAHPAVGVASASACAGTGATRWRGMTKNSTQTKPAAIATTRHQQRLGHGVAERHERLGRQPGRRGRLRRPGDRPWAASRLSIATAIAAEPRTAPTWRVAL